MGRLTDLKKGEAKEVDLRNDAYSDKQKKNAEKLEENTHKIYKKNDPIKHVKDLHSNEKLNFLYIRGQKFTPPKYLGGLLKIFFVGFLILFTINSISVYFSGKKLQSEIEAQAYEGFNFLVSGGKSASKTEFENALSAFDSALGNFDSATESLWFIDRDNSLYASEKGQAQAVNALLRGGKHFATSGSHFLEAIEEFNKIPVYLVNTNSETQQPEKPSVTDTLATALQKTELAIDEIALASENLDSIDESVLPSEIALRVQLAKRQVDEISKTLQKSAENFPALLKLLGDRYPHRYLILLQNNNEIRPTGGFIGSYALVDLNEGYIQNLEVHDVYDIDGSYGGIIEPPEELKSFTSNWRFRDSNYSPDFPTSAAKARWMLEEEGGPTVDTVIAINQGLLQDLLEITGPIEVGDFGPLSSGNYNLLLSFIIEGKVWGAEDPKHILKVFIPEFKKAILKEEYLGKLSGKIIRAIQQKHILAWSPDPEIQSLLQTLELDGTVTRSGAAEDYLSVINVNVGGTKSDQFINEEISHHSEISATGEIIDTLTITRTHTWTDDIYNSWRRILRAYGFDEMPDQIIDILGRGDNRVLSRVYVPEGSILLESNAPTGTEVSQSTDTTLDKTYFTTELHTPAGSTTTLTLKYRLPYNLNFSPTDTYKLTVEKQPGSRGSIFTKTVTTSPELSQLSTYPAEAKKSTNQTTTYATNLVYDRYFSAIWKK